MSQSTLLKTLLEMAGGTKPVIIHPSLVKFTGSLEAGILLSQLFYWTPRAKLPGGWIAKSDDEWMQETCLSRHGVRQARARLEEMDILETKLKKFAGAPTTHYRLKQLEITTQWETWINSKEENAANPLSENGQSMGLSENGQSMTESTSSESTSKETPTASVATDERQNVTFEDWLDDITKAKNKQAAVARMVDTLFPHQFPDGTPKNYYGYAAKRAREVGGYKRLAQLVWQAASLRPVGDVLSYCLGLAKGQSARQADEGARHIEYRDGHQVIKVP